jgi:histone deacetylase 1/2
VKEGTECIVYLTSVVDDMLITCESESLTLDVVKRILTLLPGKHEGIAKLYNGFAITWLEDGGVLLSQPKHIQGLHDAFKGKADMSKFRTLPMKEGVKLCKAGTSDNMKSAALDVEQFHYRSLVGGLNYISNGTRPDVTFTVNQLSKYSNAPTVAHWEAAIDCLRYLYSTITWGIKLGAGGQLSHFHWVYRTLAPEPDAVAYADANHGTGIDDKKSISGIVVQVLGGPVSWASRVQAVTSTSTTESEFRALSEASKEVLWLAKIVRLFGISTKPFLIRGDSQGAIGSIKNASYTPHTKHIEIHHDFMKDRYQMGDLDFHHIAGVDNPSDIFTKALGRVKFERFRTMLGMDSV